MSSNIPTRRATRVTRLTQKEDENANARPSRLITRAKPSTNSTAASTGGSSKAAGAVDPAQGKRKREALGELTSKVANNRAKGGDAKGKAKDDSIIKPGKAGAIAERAPLRPVASRTRAKAAEKKKVESKDDDAMAVDLPTLPPVPIVLIPVHPVAKQTAIRASYVSTTTTVTSRRAIGHRTLQARAAEPDEDLLEEPAPKKRRTSSEVGDDAVLEVIEEEQVVDAVFDAGGEEELDVDWDDLDKDDHDDPMMVSEYVVEIFNYLKEVEQSTMPNPNYMENQKELAWKMRGILMDWLIQLHTRFRLSPETLFLCVNLIDRFLSARVVSLAKLQLVGVTCMFVAAKVEEMVAPTVSNFVYCADSSYTEAEILQAEKYVLKTIDWNLSFPSPLNFLRRISKADDYNIQVRTIGKYLVEVGCLEWRLLAAPPSLMAASSMWLARLILDAPEWTPNLRHYSSYPENALLPTANLILNYLLKPVTHDSFFKKYASKRYMKASLFVREWVLDRWEERAQVDLEAELPKLKDIALQKRALNPQAYEQ